MGIAQHMEVHALDHSKVLMETYQLADMIGASVEVSEYLYWKDRVNQNEEVQVWVRKLQSQKDLFEECQRFGHFHPEYHKALDRVREVEAELDRFEDVRQFKAAEAALDDLLYTVSKMIANAVSDSIKVPSNQMLPETGCSSGGSCGCG